MKDPEVQMIERYRQFIQDTDQNPFDFLAEKKELHFDFIKEEAKQALEVIGKNKAGSLVCIYKSSIGEMVVWLDSEAWPSAVISESIEAFFSILPHGTGHVYNIISFIMMNRTAGGDLCAQFSAAFDEFKTKYDEKTIELYERIMGIKTADKVCEIILRSINKYQDEFSKILKS